MNRFFAIFERDLRKFIRNPLVMLVSILMPVIYLVILGSSFQGELKNLPVAVVDYDAGPYARRVLEMLRSIEAGPKTLDVYIVPDQVRAMNGLKDGTYKALLIIPDGFSRALLDERSEPLGLFLDNADMISSKTVHTAIAAALPELKKEFLSIRGLEEGRVISSNEIYRKIDYDQTLIPGVVIMAIFLGAMTTGAFNMVMDKFLGIEESYFLTPLTKTDIVAGLVASGLIITTFIALIVLFISGLISGLYLWSLVSLDGFLLIVAVIVLSTLGLQGLMFVVMGRINHPRIVGVMGGFLNVIFFFPSGAIYPIESFPGWLKAFAMVNPETYSVDALRALLFKGAGFTAIRGDLAFLAVFAAASVLVGMITFKRRL